MPNEPNEIECYYQKLSSIREDLEHLNQNPDGVFHTYVGERYCEASSRRLMIVGKATMGWGECGHEGSRDFVIGKVAERKYSSHFWHFIRTLSARLHDHLNPDDLKALYERVVWSNIMRIGVNGGNPKGSTRNRQRDLCAALTKAEVKSLRPTHLVFTTGNDYWDEVCAVVGAQSRCELEEDVWRLYGTDRGMNVYWTRHPQGWSSIRKERAIQHIINGG